jgi:Family of unknown function (DUF6088)
MILQKTMQPIEKQIVSRIYGRGRGWAFSANDFSADFGRSTVDWVFYNLVAAGTIRRVYRGVYDYPKYSELLQQQLSPDFDQVAQAFARKFNWRIQPSGDAALNLLGLSTQVPGRLVYLSDGPNRQYQVGDSGDSDDLGGSASHFTLEFKKSALKDVGFKYRESGLLVQALKALGKERIDDAVITTLRKQLDEATYKRVLRDTVTATGWVYDAIKRICGERG